MERGDWEYIANELEETAAQTSNADALRTAGEGLRTELPGAVVPNQMLMPPDGLWMYENSIYVEYPTPLATFLRRDTGNWTWAACTPK